MFIIPVLYIYLYFSHKTYEHPAVFRGVSCQMFLFHLWLMLLGFKTYYFNKKYIWFSLSLFGVIGVLIFIFNEANFSLQAYKFPTTLPYIIATMISIGAAMGFKKQIIKSNFFTYLGENAMSFYLAQGISSSILYSIVKIIELNWVLKLSICFSYNFIMAMVIGLLISKIVPKITFALIK